MSAAQLFLPASRAFNSNGLPVAGAVLKLYTTGTLVPQPIYSDSALTISLGSSVTANAAGRFETVYQDNATPFRLRLETSTGVELDDIDPFYFGQMDVSLDTIYPAALGLFTGMSALTIPTGIDIVSTTGYSVLDRGGASYVYDAAVDSTYVAAYPRASFLSANSRGFRLSHEQDFHVDMFGATGDYNGTTGTDNAAAFAAAMVYLQAITQARPDIGAVWRLGNTLSLRNGGRYYTTAPFNIISSLLFVDFTGSEIIYPANTFGIVINADTTDVEATRTSGAFPLNCTLVNPCLRGANGTNRNRHGIWMRRTAFIIKPEITGFSGDGIRIGNSNGQTAGNQNGWRVSNPVISRCGGDGMHAEGADASAGFCDNYNIALCGRFAVTDLSAAGNKWNGQSADCGVVQSGVNTVPAFVYHAGTGKNWAIVVGQEANTTVTPSTSRPDVWIDLGAGTGTDPAIPAWTSGITMEAGGSLNSASGSGAVQFDHPYMETGPYSVFQLNSGSVIRDLIGSNLGIGGTVEYPSNGGLTNNGRYTVTTTDTTGTSSMQIGGYGIGGVNFFGKMQDTSGNNWAWRADGGYYRLQDNQASQPLIATPLPGSGINFGRSTDQPGTAFFYQLAIGYSNAGRIVDMNTAAPTTGYHARGEIVFNNAPSAAGKIGWVCTTAGTPGTWKQWGVIDA